MVTTTHETIVALLEAALKPATPTADQSAAMQAYCIDHTGGVNEQGYGRVYVRREEHRAHGLASAEAHGLDIEDIKSFDVSHDCDRKLCCNPAHLRLATNDENVEGKLARNRQARVRERRQRHGKTDGGRGGRDSTGLRSDRAQTAAALSPPGTRLQKAPSAALLTVDGANMANYQNARDVSRSTS